MRLRPATLTDAADIAAIWNHHINSTLATFNAEAKSADDVAALIAYKLANARAFIVACDPGVVGFAYYGSFRSGIGYAKTAEHSIYVADDAQGRGIGRALLAQIEDHARNAGIHSMIAGVAGGNPAGAAFHTRMGYTIAAVLPQVGYKFGQWYDLTLMQKFL